ncbi:hypothetical protein PV328_011536 [Microctonus aethiopoides]|uniref:TIL domain-containing protein n=1 Tax=Microctonus aethiopoides TaxID=144406 RepID=A0AA39EYM5_9HYME|nr:hypothetical protein PV328_011536 [Microctonus aethiopoides]
MMNSPLKNSLFTIAIVASIITLGQCCSHSGIGNCSKPCTGGPADLCVACASYCVKTCEDPTGGGCIPECNENACECMEGFLRASNGQCVLPFQCPQIEPPKPQCPVCTGGVHDKCVECGTDCPKTCENPNPQACTKRCNLNVCQCEEGYVRAPDGECVLPSQCPLIEPPIRQCPICTGGIHDKCVECGSDCPRTCKNPNPQVCTLRCNVDVCECEEGYVRAPNGQCVLQSQCPVIDPVPNPDPQCPICTGGPHDHCTSCGSACAPACGKPTDIACAAVCLENVCQCDDGYVRGPNNQCILRSQCPKKCHRKRTHVG